MDTDSAAVLQRLGQAMAANKAIPYGEGMPDKEAPQVLWYRYGLVETNEIVVVARFGAEELAIADASPLLYPAMADRIFGMDVDDVQLAFKLSDRLWPAVKARLENSRP